MLYVLKEIGRLPVSVFLNTLATLMWPADLSVWSIQIVLQTRPVSGTSVLIPVLELVASMHSVMLGIILQCVPVCKDMKEILLFLVSSDP